LKALKLNEVDGVMQVEGLDVVEHEHTLSEPDIDRNQLIRTALETFLSRNEVSGSSLAVAVSGQSGFTRFVKLPPVESKKIPELVRFEAEQQIPFPINDVIWRWQAFHDPNSPDVEVGIFAMKKVDIAEMLAHFDDVQLNVDVVQMAPLALFNFMQFDGQAAPDGATLLADVGADKTDLIVGDGPRIWTRTIQIGGSDFTEALVKAFKLSFAKAEKLKRSAATSKYARQIFQAMRPVFADMAQEIQRSVGYYTSMRREARFKRMVGLGNGFRLPGLQKFLEQQLNMPVLRVDSFNRLTAASGGAVNAPMLDENVLSFAVAYGLAVQGLDMSQVTTNLLPDDISRRRLWGRKKPWFAASAALLLAAMAGPAYRGYVDRAAMAEGDAFRQAQVATRELTELKSKYDALVGGLGTNPEIENYKTLFGYRTYWPSLEAVVAQAMRQVASDQPLIESYASAPDDNARQQILQKIAVKPRKQRRMLFVEDMQASYAPDISGLQAKSLVSGPGEAAPAPANPAAPATNPKPGYVLRFKLRTPLDKSSAQIMLTDLRKKAEAAAKEFPIVGFRDGAYGPYKEMERATPVQDVTPVGGAEGDGRAKTAAGQPPVQADPFLPSEGDTWFQVAWIVSIEGDGLPKPAEPTPK
jgi:type IV pilus assembly protein PilM